MAIQEVVIHEHKVRMGRDTEQHIAWDVFLRREILAVLSTIDVRKLEVFNLRSEFASFEAGSTNRAIIFGNGAQRPRTAQEGTKTPTEITLAGQSAMVNLLSASDRPNNINITDDNDVVIAQYNKDWNELYIHFNIFGEFDEFGQTAFKYILEKWYEQYWKIKDMEDSWLNTSDKNGLISRFEGRFKQAAERQLRDDKAKAERFEHQIEEAKRNIANYYTNMIRLRNNIETEEANVANVGEKLKKELDLIVSNPKVSDLHIKNGIFNIYVPKVYIYDDRDNRYYGGNYRIEIKLEEANVKFFGDNPRAGYWTPRDPHPHVNGNSGTACLGSVAGTIAELSSRNELYALTLTCIDFLEAANTGDPAGRKVANWDRVDEEGKIISSIDEEDFEEEDDDRWTCECCEESQPGDDGSTTVYQSYRGDADGSGDWGTELYVCDECVEENYTWSDELNEYVRNGNLIIDDEDGDDE